MAQPRFRAPRGTRDILPPESDRRRELVGRFADLAARSGYGQLESPIFEDVGVFQRLGPDTDVVAKEMFELHDRSDPPQHLALRPELTASACRAYAEHRPTPPWKIWYEGPQFRYERPQAGRYRQFSQVGAEVIGADDPAADVEAITLAVRFFEALGLTGVRLLVNSLGDPADRSAYLAALGDHLQSHSGELSPQARATAAHNPLRVLDSKRPEDQAAAASAPVMIDHLSAAAAEHFEAVRAGLDDLGVEYEVCPRLVRGLDYYVRTAFEFAAPSLGAAQDAVGGGGRYDGLVEDLGGPAAGGIGFALGVDRMLLACDAEGAFGPPVPMVEVFAVDVAGGMAATKLCDQLRRAGLGADRAFGGRSMKAQMKLADRSGAALALIVGPDELAAGEVTVRDLQGSSRQYRVSLEGAVSAVEAELARPAPGEPEAGR